MRKLLAGLACGILLANGLAGQSPWSFGIRAGAMAGGPIPMELDRDSSSGKMAVGPAGGAFVAYRLADRWHLQLGIGYAGKGATYQQTYRDDTLMPLEIFPGVVDTVPTYYIADVNGKMRLHYLELPLLGEWRATRRMWLQAGAYLGALLGGKDAGTIDVQIGNGQVFPDTSTTFDNIGEIRRLDVGLVVGGRYQFAKGPFVEFRAQRSLRGLYRPGFLSSQGLEEVGLFHTQFYIGLGWIFGHVHHDQ